MYHHTLALLLLVVAALQAGCHPPLPGVSPANPTRPSMHEGYADAGNGVRLFYRVVGSGRDTIVVIHGGPGFSMEYFAEDLRSLSERHTLVFYDQRGTGRSSLVTDSAALDAGRFAEDVEALRRHFGLGRVTMLGHSWGAGVAALYAMRHPERVAGMLLVGGIPLRRSELDRTFRGIAANRDSASRRRMQEAREVWLSSPGDATACRAYYVLWFGPFFGDPTAAGRSKGDFCAGTPAALRNKIASVDRFTAASLGDWDWRPSLRGVSARTLVIHGTADVIPVESAREWAAALPNARLLLLDGVGHFPYLEVPDRFNAAVDEFMAGRWPAGAEPGSRP